MEKIQYPCIKKRKKQHVCKHAVKQLLRMGHWGAGPALAAGVTGTATPESCFGSEEAEQAEGLYTEVRVPWRPRTSR